MIDIDIKKNLYGAHGEMTLCVDKHIDAGEFIVLTGESGSGKTTLLRVLAGLEEAEGKIEVNGKHWLRNRKNMKPQKREIGFVFQDYALFDNMSVEENLLFVNHDRALAKQLLEMTELSMIASRNIQSLSGGQKQRIGLCRAMMTRPKFLLMDEPLSAIDVKMRNMLREEIKKLHRMFEITTIMVSHDSKDTAILADRVWVMEQGGIVVDTTIDAYLRVDKKHEVEIIGINRREGIDYATILLDGVPREVEVDQHAKVGDAVDLVLSSKSIVSRVG